MPEQITALAFFILSLNTKVNSMNKIKNKCKNKSNSMKGAE
jgi:hypothetical protein